MKDGNVAEPDQLPSGSQNTLLAVRSDHHCLGCGSENPFGLHLRFVEDEQGVHTYFIADRRHQGFEGIVHGGIISTLLDESRAWATAAAGVWAVTAEMSVRFRKPLAVGYGTTITARVTATRGRIVSTSAEVILDTDRALIAEATASFMRVSERTEASWRERYLVARSEQSEGCDLPNPATPTSDVDFNSTEGSE